MRTKVIVMIVSIIVVVLGVAGCKSTPQNTSETTSLTNNSESVKLRYSKNDIGVLRDYYQSYDGKWHAENKEYNYRMVLTGKLPNAECQSKYVVLSNDRTLSFEKVAWSILSSNSSDWLDQEVALLVELY